MTYTEMKNFLAMLDDPALRMEAVMDFGSHMAPVPATATCYEINGCASHAEICRDGNRFYGVADSALVRGIIAILTAMVDGRTPDEIRNMDIAGEFASLNINLGAGRMSGLNSMIRFLQNL